MATYTTNYGLHQWVPEDDFLRTDFNTDFAKIDAALGEKAEASALAEKCGAVFGSYSGNDGENREISLGFAPKGVLLYCGETNFVMAYTGAPRMSHQDNKTMLAVTDNGFQVYYGYYHSGLTDYDYRPVTNKSGVEYRYLAVK